MAATRGVDAGEVDETALTLTADQVQATLAPQVGGRLTSLRVAGVERLVAERERLATGDRPDPLAWGCYPMAPWVGRLEAARVPWGDRDAVVAADHGRHAIHGLMHSRPWVVRERTATTATLVAPLPSDWPWSGRVEQEVAVSPSSLLVCGTVDAAQPMPAALGWHPWWRFDDATAVELRVPADRVLVTDDELVATGETRPVAGETDLRSGPRLGARRLDHTYIGLHGPVGFAWPDVVAELEPGPGVVAVHVFVTERAVCIEPLSAWPNAHVLDSRGVDGTGLATVVPGSPLRASWRLRLRRRAGQWRARA